MAKHRDAKWRTSDRTPPCPGHKIIPPVDYIAKWRKSLPEIKQLSDAEIKLLMDKYDVEQTIKKY